MYTPRKKAVLTAGKIAKDFAPTLSHRVFSICSSNVRTCVVLYTHVVVHCTVLHFRPVLGILCAFSRLLCAFLGVCSTAEATTHSARLCFGGQRKRVSFSLASFSFFSSLPPFVVGFFLRKVHWFCDKNTALPRVSVRGVEGAKHVRGEGVCV